MVQLVPLESHNAPLEDEIINQQSLLEDVLEVLCQVLGAVQRHVYNLHTISTTLIK